MIARRLLPALLACVAASGQPYTYVTGSIYDPSGAAVPGAAITIVNEDSGFRRTTESQPDGSYTAGSLHPGSYKITVRKEGFHTMIRFGIRLPARVNFTLAVGSMQEIITVEGSPTVLATDNAAPATSVRQDEIERLPINGRGLLSLLDLAPATTITPATRGEAGQFTSNGQRPNTHYFTIDGVSANTGVSGGGLPAQVTGGSLPAMSAIGSFHSLVSVEAVQEFRIQTSSVAPEVGRLPGAQVSIQSRSGSNDFHGSLLYAMRNEALDANDWFANRQGEPRAKLRLQDLAASLGGPVRRNRTFFFASYEGMRLRQPFAWRAPVPSPGFRESAPEWAQPVLDLFPGANGPALGDGIAEWTGRNRRPSRVDAGSLRIDQAVTSRVTLFARYNESPSMNEFGNTQISHLDLRFRSMTVGWNARPGAGLTFEGRANFSSAHAQSMWLPDAGCELKAAIQELLHKTTTCNELVRFSIAGLGNLLSGREGERRQSQYQVAQTIAWARGPHTLRIGGDYRRLGPQRHDDAETVSIIAENLADLTANRNLWIASAPPQQASGVLREVSLFAQDTWQLTPRFTATYGLRWEYSPPPDMHGAAYYLDPETNTYFSLDRPVWPGGLRYLAPRGGVAYRAGSKTVVRAGGGVYYDSSLSIGTDLINGGPLSLAQYGSARHAPFSMLLGFGFVPNVRLPRIVQWTAGVDHAATARDVFSLRYSGSAGRDLLRREMGGAGSSEVVWIALSTNAGESDYHALAFEYRRALSRRVQGRAAYTWAHSIDNSSSDAALHWAGAGSPAWRDRGSSDFDVRHALTASMTYEGFQGWALDGVLRARTGFPITVLNSEEYYGISFANSFRPDVVAGAPLWVRDASVPGGRRLNRDAFAARTVSAQGSLGRNAIAGFGMYQIDLAVRREFRFAGERSIQVRLEAFNVLNHANFADPYRYLSGALFGQPASMLNLMLGTGSPGSGLTPMFQSGGPRSLQVNLRLGF